MKKGDKTVTRSFRISERASDVLQEDAQRRKISVNTLVNQIFLAHADFDRYFERMGLVKISSATFELLLAGATEEKVIEAARSAGGDTARTIIEAKEGTLTFNTVINFLKIMSEHSNLFEYNEVDVNGKRVITLMHNLGKHGSLFLTHYAKAIFQVVGLEPAISSSAHSVTIEVSPAAFPKDGYYELRKTTTNY